MSRSIFSFVFCALAFSQETIDHASVSGRVLDPSGSAVDGAHVTARQLDTNTASEALTDREGRFRFPDLKVGPYQVTVRHPGFAISVEQAEARYRVSFSRSSQKRGPPLS